jgi:hypothetical protein
VVSRSDEPNEGGGRYTHSKAYQRGIGLLFVLLSAAVLFAVLYLTRELLRDFDTFRQFITGSGIHAIFDLPWAPIYIAVIFVLHPLLGAFALGCSVTLVLMAFFKEWMVKPPLAESNEAAARSYNFTEMSLRNIEVVRAMGMTTGLRPDGEPMVRGQVERDDADLLRSHGGPQRLPIALRETGQAVDLFNQENVAWPGVGQQAEQLRPWQAWRRFRSRRTKRQPQACGRRQSAQGAAECADPSLSATEEFAFVFFYNCKH